MPRQSFIWDREQGTFRPKSDVLAERAAKAAAERSPLPSPMVIGDNIGGIQGLRHPSTGEFIDSKSRFRAETRARGLTEIGNEAFPVRKAPSEAELAREIAADVAQAYDAIENGAEVAPARSADAELINVETARVPDAGI